MALLILGILLWSLPHLFKRIAPAARARMGDGPAKGVVAVLSILGIVCMVIGYKQADPVFLYALPSWAVHLNNLLMLIAVLLLAVGHSKSRLRRKLRHPMLSAAVIWAVAHLLVNGDVPSLVLFGGLLIWAVVSMLTINAREHDYVPYAGGSVAGDVRLAIITLVVFVVIVFIHGWVGPWPLGGGA